VTGASSSKDSGVSRSTAAVHGAGPYLSPPTFCRHDRTSPWPLTPPPPAGRFVDAVAAPPSSSSPSRYVQPPLLHYLIQQQVQTSRRSSTAAGSSSPGCYHHPRTGHAAGGSAGRWAADWRCGLRPSGAVSFRAVVDGDECLSSSAADDHSSRHEMTSQHNNRLI